MPKIFWTPQAGPQVKAWGCPSDFTFFGGSRGGGKSDCLIGRQLRGAERWDKRWNGLVLRRKYKDFAEIRRRFDELITDGLEATRIGGDQQTNHVRFKNGASVTLAAIQKLEQVNDFVGHQYTEIAFDEATMFPFFIKMVDKLKGSCRSPHGVPCRMFGTGNPGGPGHLQVKEYFGLGTGGVPPETVMRQKLEGGLQETRIFIPSFLDDNKILCLNDPMYVARLKSIADPALKRAWIMGDWDVFIGQAFQFSEKYHVVPPQPVPLGAPLYMTFDWGYGKPFSIGWWWVDLEGRVYRFSEWYGASGIDEGLRIVDDDIALGIKEREQKLGISDRQITRLAGPDCWNKKPDYQGGGQGASTAEVWSRHQIFLTHGDPSRALKIRQFRTRLNYKLNEDGQLIQLPMMVVYSTCKDFIRTVPALVMSDLNPEDIDTDMEDHCFTGGTLVDTDRGQIAIKDMAGKSGKVLTAGGYWTDFNACKMTSLHADVVKVDFRDGRSIVCTYNHKFYTKTKGYIKAKDLTDEECHISISLNKHLRKAGIWKSKSSISGHRNSTEPNTIYVGNTSKDMVGDYIELFGNILTDRSQRSHTYIMTTRIDQIIRKAILSLRQVVATALYTLKKTIMQHGLSLCTMELQSGTEANPGLNGIDNNIGRIALVKSIKKSLEHVIVAKNIFDHPELNSVQENASNVNGSLIIDQKGYAQNAEIRILDSERLVQALVQQERHGKLVRVKSVKPFGKADVYCLNAADTHAFCVEGGILVHNCYDEACHIAMARPMLMMPAPIIQNSHDKRIDNIQKGNSNTYEHDALMEQHATMRQLDRGNYSDTMEYDDGLRGTT